MFVEGLRWLTSKKLDESNWWLSNTPMTNRILRKRCFLLVNQSKHNVAAVNLHSMFYRPDDKRQTSSWSNKKMNWRWILYKFHSPANRLIYYDKRKQHIYISGATAQRRLWRSRRNKWTFAFNPIGICGAYPGWIPTGVNRFFIFARLANGLGGLLFIGIDVGKKQCFRFESQYLRCNRYRGVFSEEISCEKSSELSKVVEHCESAFQPFGDSHYWWYEWGWQQRIFITTGIVAKIR